MKPFLFLVAACILNLFGCTKGDKTPSAPMMGTLASIKSGLNYVVATGSISNQGNSTIIKRGFCVAVTPNPTVDSSFLFISSSTATSFTDTIRGLAANAKYYIRSFATNTIGTSYSATDSFQTLQSPYSFGQSFQGGWVFYVDSTGEHGLICAKQVGHTYWDYSYPGQYLGIRNTAIGYGQQNTFAILSADTVRYRAAKYCVSYTADGYHDWYLPSYEELQLLRANMFFSGWLNVPGDLYWTSSEIDSQDAWIVALNANASFRGDDKNTDHGVMPIRKF